MKREVVVPETERLKNARGLRLLKVVLPFGADILEVRLKLAVVRQEILRTAVVEDGVRNNLPTSGKSSTGAIAILLLRLCFCSLIILFKSFSIFISFFIFSESFHLQPQFVSKKFGLFVLYAFHNIHHKISLIPPLS